VIVTVTLNPAIDETVTLETLRPGHVHRASAVAFHAGGKGVNVASCLADWGAKVTATGILGAGNAGLFERLAAEKGFDERFLRVPGETRTNIKLSHDGDTTDINLPGLVVRKAELDAFVDTLTGLAEPEALFLLAGSVPTGVAPEIYAELTRMLSGRGAKVVLDTSGAALRAALAGARLPYAVKPNRAELEEFAGRALPRMGDVVAAARGLGVALTVVSLGADGAVFVTAEAALHASAPPVAAASTVGAGDAMVAGILAAMAEDAGLERIARLGTAFAVCKLGQAGPNLPGRDVVEECAGNVTVKEVR
jgi:1-phosphofructokinase